MVQTRESREAESANFFAEQHRLPAGSFAPRTSRRSMDLFAPQPMPNNKSPFDIYGAAPVAGFPQYAPGIATSAVAAGNSGARTGFVVAAGQPASLQRNPFFATSSSSSSSSGNINHHLHDATNNLHHHNHPSRSYPLAPPFAMADDREEQEALARDFQQGGDGPLVGEKQSSHIITQEYAKADPVYVAKTAALPQTYSHFRSIQGDGICGWRAVSFSYFEMLVRTRSRDHINREFARLVSLRHLITSLGGFQDEFLDEMEEEPLRLLKDLAGLVESPENADAVLLERFNDPGVAPNLVYYLRLLASTQFRMDPDSYTPFIENFTSVDDYVRNHLEPTTREIDHVGVALLAEILTKPANFNMDIVILDRSAGSEVNTNEFHCESPAVLPTLQLAEIHLLFRPTHYDVIYKPAIQPYQPNMGQLIGNPDLKVHRATSFSQQHTIQPTVSNFSNMDMPDLFSIPGLFSCGPPPPQNNFQTHYNTIEQSQYPATIQQPAISPMTPGLSPTSTSTMSLSSNFPLPQQSHLASPGLTTSYPPTSQLAIHPMPSSTIQPSPSPLSSELASPVSASSSFRPSKYEWAAAADWQEGPISFQTSSFRNSHYNTAHFANPNFQPEEWTPDMEEEGNGRKKST